MNLSETLAARARGESVAIATLILFDFGAEPDGRGGPVRVWTGAGEIVVDGDIYHGRGEFVTVNALPLGTGDSAGQATFTLTGANDELMKLARSFSHLVVGREVTVWKQFLSAPHTPLDSRIFVGSWIMMEPRFMFSGPSTRTITVNARSIFDDRNLREELYYTDRYLQSLFPGDVFFEFISQITAGMKVEWPDY